MRFKFGYVVITLFFVTMSLLGLSDSIFVNIRNHSGKVEENNVKKITVKATGYFDDSVLLASKHDHDQ